MAKNFITSSNAQEIVSRKIEPFELPNHEGTWAHVRQLPIGVLQRLSKSSSKTTSEGDKARCEMIRLSIVNEDGSEVFTEEEAADLMQSSAPIFTDLLLVIGKANNKAAADVDADLEESAKN